MSFFRNVQKQLQQNIREYGMYIALAVIMVVFTITTKRVFISARNISNLVNQTGYIAVLAVGMTLVIVIRCIDLSVGFCAGFLGAVAAIALAFWHWNVWAVILLVLVLGVLAGLLSGFLVTRMGIPSFVATLAGWLGYRGALQMVTAGTGTIIIDNDTFNAISNGFVPDILKGIPILPEMHKLTLLLGLLAIAAFVYSQISDRRKKQAYFFEVVPMDMFILQLVFVSLVIGAMTWVLAGYQGLSWTFVVVLIVTAVYTFVTTQTVLGRHIYAIGGNPEAAELSGINVKRLTNLVFASMGLLTGLCGILFASRLRSASTTAGQLFEMDAIAAAYVGGVSAAGGVGKVTGSIIGAFVMAALVNGMNLMGIDISMQYLVRAIVLALAVIFDVYTRKRAR